MLMLNLNPIVVPKAADVLAHSLREQILDGRLAEGAALPNERDLASQAGLSRASVREALRILEVEGLVTTRTGRHGGTEVARPGMATVERTVGIFIRGQRIRFEAVLEAREALEPQAARLAALHHRPDDWAALARSHQRLQDGINDIPAFLDANLAWHIDVVRAGHNELLIAFTQAIAQSVHAATDLRGLNSPEVRRAVVQAHQKVMDAIQQGDGDAAARRMGRHVGAYVASVQPRASRPGSTSPPDSTSRRTPQAAAPPAPPGKRARKAG